MENLTNQRFKTLGLLVLLNALLCTSIAQKVLDLDTGFLHHSERWTPSVQFKLSGYPKATIGPFKIDQIDKINAEDISPIFRSGILYENLVKQKLRTLRYHIIYNEQDSILVESHISEKDTYTNETALGSRIFGEQAYGTLRTQNVCLELFISLPGDTAIWHYIDALIDTNTVNRHKDYYGKLISPNNEFEVRYTRGYQDAPKRFNNYLSGIKIASSNDILAAYQFDFKKYIWLSKNVGRTEQLALGALMAVLLSVKEK